MYFAIKNYLDSSKSKKMLNLKKTYYIKLQVRIQSKHGEIYDMKKIETVDSY